ncbi:hypothetical protein DV736_g4635, partial [Chaetothyriales sp. CBS 134916]
MGRSTRRGPWLPQEDATLLHLVHLSGPNNWVRISQHMQHRSPKQCRERYHQNLKPSLNHEPISNDEGELIEQLVQEIGKRWAEIARRLGNRSDNAVKNWWNGSMNRRRRNTPHGVSRVGPRQLPISAAAAPRAHSSTILHTHHVHHLRPQSQPPLHESFPLSLPSTAPLSIKTGDAPSPLQHSSAGITPTYTSQPPVTSDQKPLKLELHGRPAVSSSLPSPSSLDLAGCPSLLQHLQAPYSGSMPRPTPAEQRPDWPLPRVVDLPAISPATSEFSSTGSIPQPPSLVSDNLSHYSISPKTISSPPPGLCTAIAPSGQNSYPEEQKSGYTIDIGSSKGIKYEGDESTYPASAFNESGLDDFTHNACPNRPNSNVQSARRVDEQFSNRSSPVEKDSRMSVSRLLD